MLMNTVKASKTRQDRLQRASKPLFLTDLKPVGFRRIQNKRLTHRHRLAY